VNYLGKPLTIDRLPSNVSRSASHWDRRQIPGFPGEKYTKSILKQLKPYPDPSATVVRGNLSDAHTPNLRARVNTGLTPPGKKDPFDSMLNLSSEPVGSNEGIKWELGDPAPPSSAASTSTPIENQGDPSSDKDKSSTDVFKFLWNKGEGTMEDAMYRVKQATYNSCTECSTISTLTSSINSSSSGTFAFSWNCSCYSCVFDKH
jgi:hypothetical protein